MTNGFFAVLFVGGERQTNEIDAKCHVALFPELKSPHILRSFIKHIFCLFSRRDIIHRSS